MVTDLASLVAVLVYGAGCGALGYTLRLLVEMRRWWRDTRAE